MSPDEQIFVTVHDIPEVLVLGTSHFPGSQGPEGPMGPPGETAGNTTIVDLTSSQLLDLINTPLEVIPAQGPGTIVLVRSLVNHYKHNTVAYYGGEPGLIYGMEAEENIKNIPGLVNRRSDWVQQAAEIEMEGDPEDIENKPVFLGYTTEELEDNNTINYYGKVDEHELKDGGVDYVVGDTGGLNVYQGDTNYEVLSVDGTGAILTYSLTTEPGRDMVAKVGTMNTYPAGGIGTNFEIDILSIFLGDGDIRLYLEWSIFYLGS